jgi:hypothetical protein
MSGNNAMNVMVRGIPTFVYVQPVSVTDIETFLAGFELRVSRFMDVRAEYFQIDTWKRVSLYLEGTEANRAVLEAKCLNNSHRSMKACTMTVKDDLTVKSAGTASSIRTNEGTWYMLDPKLDPRYPALLAELKAKEKEAARLAQIEEDKEDELRMQLEELVDAVGYSEAIRRIKEGST